jgi:predicted nucleic acid-binding protein
MVKALFDTNILIDYLQGIDAAAKELSRYATRAISIITWMEVLAGTTPQEDAGVRAWLQSFHVIGLDSKIADRAVTIRKARHVRLPDAIIQATAEVHSFILVTRNTRDFPKKEPGIRIPYRLDQ